MPYIRRTRPWDFGRPARDFVINKDSRQAVGLRAWWPLTEKHRVADRSLYLQTRMTSNGTTAINREKDLGHSIKFTASGTGYYEIQSAVYVTLPFSFVAWFNPNDVTSNYAIMSESTFSANDRYVMFLSGTTTDAVSTQAATTPTSAIAESSVSYVASKWQHAAGVFESTTLRSSYLNGGNKGTNSTSVNPTGMNRTQIAARMASGLIGLHMDGRITDVRIYDRVLTDADVAELYAEETRWQLYYPVGRKSWMFVGRVPTAPTPTTVPVRLVHLKNQEIL